MAPLSLPPNHLILRTFPDLRYTRSCGESPFLILTVVFFHATLLPSVRASSLFWLLNYDLFAGLFFPPPWRKSTRS